MATDPETDGSPAATNKALDELDERLDTIELGGGSGGLTLVEDPPGSGLFVVGGAE